MADGPEFLARSTLGDRPLPFSSAVRIGDILYLSGQMGLRDDGTLADMALWPDFNKVYLEYFSEPLPTRSAFGANGLALGGLVELECQAYAGDR